ncbi:spore germination protein [Gorillibacterium timonense]|uniref:spore germination protein n=1 Tax=Gorillibacterium timonense TaxID=1689269 RepID=UPI00071D9ADF|nr:spore germination protein [Gorillibacterium timonense]
MSVYKPMLSKSLRDNLNELRKLLHNPDDLQVKFIKAGGTDDPCLVLYMDGLADDRLIQEDIIHLLQTMKEERGKGDREAAIGKLLDDMEARVLPVGIARRTTLWQDLIPAVLSGDTVLLIEGCEQGVVVKSRKWPERAIEEPQTEALVRGPRIGFTESIFRNLALLRRQIRDKELVFETQSIGRRSNQVLAICYIQDIVNLNIVEEVKRRLASVDIESAPESGTVEQWIEDSFLSPFPQLLHTERPDKVVSSMLQGKVAILVDGSPFALILPTTFVSLIQSPEDYNERWLIGSLIRLLRVIAIFITLFLPAVYIALVSFHQGLIPFTLVFSVAAAREGVPFPAFVEAVLMEGTLELLREAGLRMPKPMGQTISIVGGLVIGETAIQAGLVSPVMLIVVAVTAVASFAIPSYSAGITFRILRFCTMIASAIFGFFGIILVAIMIVIHLLRLESFGVPYTAPIAPQLGSDWRDLFIRAPLTMLKNRPHFMQPRNAQRASEAGKRKSP